MNASRRRSRSASTANQIFTFLFIMLGPIKLLAPFAKITKSSTEAERRSLALQGTLLATLTVIAASFVGVRILAKWGVAPGSLALAGGILFFLVALSWCSSRTRNTKAPPPSLTRAAPVEGAPAAAGPPVKTMVRELVPNIVTPYGIAAVILLITLMPDSSWSILGILARDYGSGFGRDDLRANVTARPWIPAADPEHGYGGPSGRALRADGRVRNQTALSGEIRRHVSDDVKVRAPSERSCAVFSRCGHDASPPRSKRTSWHSIDCSPRSHSVRARPRTASSRRRTERISRSTAFPRRG